MKTIQCQRAGCGVTVEAASNRQKFCPPCKEMERREKHRTYVARYQKKRSAIAVTAASFDRYTVRTRATVAKIMGITEEGVRVLEQSAMNKIRRALGKFV